MSFLLVSPEPLCWLCPNRERADAFAGHRTFNLRPLTVAVASYAGYRAGLAPPFVHIGDIAERLTPGAGLVHDPESAQEWKTESEAMYVGDLQTRALLGNRLQSEGTRAVRSRASTSQPLLGITPLRSLRTRLDLESNDRLCVLAKCPPHQVSGSSRPLLNLLQLIADLLATVILPIGVRHRTRLPFVMLFGKHSF